MTFKLNFEICEKQYSAKGHEIEKKKQDVFVKSKANTWELLYIEYMQEWYLDQNSNLFAISLVMFSDTLFIEIFWHFPFKQ